MRSFVLATVLLLGASPSWADHGRPASAKTADLIPLAALGNVHHPVSTHSAEAQRAFDQGLALCFAFNHDEAIRSFERAARLDSTLAMAHWGVALALGPNINLPVDADRERAAAAAVGRAKALLRHASPVEREYIEALDRRYSSDPKADLKALDVAYKEAMGALVKRHVDDLDAATLYAEAAMDLRPWAYWNPDGTPAEGTDELLAVLESVLRRDPDHVGANHYYIHAVEASTHPERALPSATKLLTLAPRAGHLVHMPSHIYIRTGDYDASARVNDIASGVDRTYITRNKVEGVYPAMYFNHNLHFSAVSHAMAGRYRQAIQPARELERSATVHAKTMPMVEGFVPTPILIDVRFRRWSDVLKSPEPGPALHITRAIRHFGRGMAHAAMGSPDRADEERTKLAEQSKAVAPDLPIGLNPAPRVLGIADEMLAARIAEARGDLPRAIDHLGRAVALEDSLAYDEPPDWYLHARESLGGALLRAKRPAEAEAVFREDLLRHPRSGRSLFGLHAALVAQNRSHAAGLVKRELDAAWKTADTKLDVGEL